MKGLLQHISELVGAHPFDDEFIKASRERVRAACQAVPVHVHNRIRAENRLCEATKEALCDLFQEEFPDALFPLTVNDKWPSARCIISGDEALISFSYSPETEAIVGGDAIEPVRIVVRRAPPTILQRLTSKKERERAERMKRERQDPYVLTQKVEAPATRQAWPTNLAG